MTSTYKNTHNRAHDVQAQSLISQRTSLDKDAAHHDASVCVCMLIREQHRVALDQFFCDRLWIIDLITGTDYAPPRSQTKAENTERDEGSW